MFSLMPPLICGIVFFTIYKIFDLFVRRNERISMIEKLSDNLDPSIIEKQMKSMSFFKNTSFMSLKIGCLCTGLGLGLLIGYVIGYNCSLDYSNWEDRGTLSIIYSSTLLLFGGISLLIAFIIEMNLTKKDK